MKNSSIIATVFFAGAAGVLAGILFAPGKGSNTRRKISQKSHKYRDYLSDGFDDIADSLIHPLENIEDKVVRLSKKSIAEII